VLLDVSEHFHWKGFTILAHSMGGHISYIFAGSFPHIPSRLLIIESVGLINKLISNSDSAAMTSFLLKKRHMNLQEASQSHSKISGKPLYKSFEEAVSLRANKGVTKLSEEAAKVLCLRGLEAVNGGYYSFIIRKHIPISDDSL
jgi:hypothetical protein